MLMSIVPSTFPPFFCIIPFKNDTLYSKFESFENTIFSLSSKVIIVKELEKLTLVMSPSMLYFSNNSLIFLYILH